MKQISANNQLRTVPLRRVFCVEWNQAGVPAEPIYSEPQTTEGVVRLFSITQIKLY